MFGAIAVLFVLPWLDTSPVRSGRFRPLFRWFTLLLLVDFVILGWVGGNRPAQPYITIGQIATAWYFIHFLVVLPLLGKLERPLPLPKSISEAVLKAKRSDEHPSELQYLMRISYAVFCLTKKKSI